MGKKTNLSKADKFYIQSHYETKSVDAITEDLGAVKSVVQKFVETLPPPTSRQEQMVKGGSLSYDEKSDVHKLMSSKSVPGITVVTPPAAERGDDSHKRRIQKVNRYYNSDTIHRPKQ